MKKLVLFDIDGTLLWTNGAGWRAFHQALLDVMETTGPIQSYRFDGKTDLQIIDDLMTAAGHPHAKNPEYHERICRRYLALLVEELNRGGARLHPGVELLLEALEQRGDVLIGLLTGNLVEGARLKLTAAGLDPARFQVGAYGSDAAARPKLPAIAVERAQRLMGRAVSGGDLVIVGDTPADMTCGVSLNARAVGVATGIYGIEDLLAAGAHAAFESLADPELVISAIFA